MKSCHCFCHSREISKLSFVASVLGCVDVVFDKIRFCQSIFFKKIFLRNYLVKKKNDCSISSLQIIFCPIR